MKRFWYFGIVCLTLTACLQKNLPPAPSSGMLPINGTRLYYEVIGEGEPVVVLHGGPGMNYAYLMPYFETLADEHQMVLFDRRACGRSEAIVDSGSIRMDTLVADIEALRIALGLERIHLMGHSWGGLLAMWYAKTYPDHLQSMILLNPNPPNKYFQDSINTRILAREPTEHRELLRNWYYSPEYQNGEQKAIENTYRLSFQYQLYNQRLLDSINFYIPGDQRDRTSQFRSMYQDLREYDLTDSLAGFTQPTLIIHGEYEYTPLAAFARLDSMLEDAELVDLPYCGHFAYLEAPEQFKRVVKQFLRKNRM
ncbi:MAG: alpha/beta fold hydrolase [Bacteroidota bacterium]